MKKYDVIVIGAGNGGLSAACYLASEGKKVLLCEKHNVPGGCATSIKRGAYEFEASLHELCQMGDGKEGRPLGDVRKLLDQKYGLDVNWLPIDEAFATVVPTEDGYDAVMPTGVEAFLDEMERQVPGSRESMTTVMELAKMVGEGVDWLAAHNNDPKGIAKVEMLTKFYDLMRVVPVSVEEMLQRIGVPKKARQIFESYWLYVGADSTRMSFAVYAYMTYVYLTQKPWVTAQRSHEISMAYDARIRELGGDIWYNAEVSRIDIRDNKVRGVEFLDGTYIPCEWVISNAMPHTVFGRMVDPKEVPERNLRSMNAQKLSVAPFTVYMGLDATAEELGLKNYDTFLCHTPDNREQYYTADRIETNKRFSVTILPFAYPELAGKGRCFLSFSKFFIGDPFAGVSEDEYFKVKDQIAMEEVGLYEKVTGCNIRDHIEEIVVASPATWARYLGTPRGDIYGYEPGDWDGMFPRVQSGEKLDYTVHGLRFVGACGTQMDGYSQAYLSGAEQARYMINDMKKEGK